MTGPLAAVLGYLFGSIPFAYLAGRLRGVDLRTVGSGNLGATNVFRTLGKGWGVAVMLLDIGKGLAAVLVAGAIAGGYWTLVAGALAFVGHVFPVWLRFKGGKGVAVAAGALIGIVPLVSVILLGTWILVVLVTRYVSLASVICAVIAAPLAALLGASWPVVVLVAAASVTVLVRHRANIRRLVRGEELRISLGRRSRGGQPGSPRPSSHS